MKKFWKYIAIAAMTAVMVPLTACDDDDELGPKSKANYEANFAYCLEQDNNYSTLTYRYSGNIVENIDETLNLVQVRLTKPAPADLTFEVSIDPTLVDEYNTAKGAEYSAMTDATIINPTITIAKGEYISADTIKVNLNGNQGLIGKNKNLLLPIAIKTVNDGITISKSGRIFIAFEYSANVVSIEDGLFQAGMDQSLWAEKMANVEFESVWSIFTADAETTVKFEIDNNLIDNYNKENGSEYIAMEGVTIEDAVILPGEQTAKIKFNVTDYSQLSTGYVIPVRIASVEGDGAIADETYNVAYFVICDMAPTISMGSPVGTQLTAGENWSIKVNGSTTVEGASATWAAKLLDGGAYSYLDYWEEGDVVEIDLGETKNVSTVAVRYYYWYYGVREYTSVRTSEDGVKWKVWKGMPDYYYEGTTNINFSYAAPARYIELTIGRPGYSVSYGTMATEIYVYGE